MRKDPKKSLKMKNFPLHRLDTMLILMSRSRRQRENVDLMKLRNFWRRRARRGSVRSCDEDKRQEVWGFWTLSAHQHFQVIKLDLTRWTRRNRQVRLHKPQPTIQHSKPRPQNRFTSARLQNCTTHDEVQLSRLCANLSLSLFYYSQLCVASGDGWFIHSLRSFLLARLVQVYRSLFNSTVWRVYY